MLFIPNTPDKIDPLPRLGAKWIPPVVIPPREVKKDSNSYDCLMESDYKGVPQFGGELSIGLVEVAVKQYNRIHDRIRLCHNTGLGWSNTKPPTPGVYVASTQRDFDFIRYWNGYKWSRGYDLEYNSNTVAILKEFSKDTPANNIEWLIRLI
jgi:hypothetical protein